MYKVMIVDDEINIRERIATKLPWEEMGFEVAASVGSGEQAWQTVKRLQPDAVLMDILMPGMSGLGLIGRIRQQYPHVKTAIMSAYDDFKYA